MNTGRVGYALGGEPANGCIDQVKGTNTGEPICT